MALQLGRSFNNALCEHFGVKRVLGVAVNNEPEELFSAAVDIALSADDLASIAARMGGKVAESEQEPVSAHFDPPATDADLARFTGKQSHTISVSIAPPDGVTAADISAAVGRQINRSINRRP